MIVDQLYQLPQQHLLELGGIYTGATALIDPDTNKPYEKTKMAKKASDSRAARAATAISLPQTTAQVPAAPIASTAMPPSAVPVTATAADIRASKLATAGAAAQSQMAAGTTVAKTPTASGSATASNIAPATFDDPAAQAVKYAKQLSISDLEKTIGTGTGTAQQRQIYSDVLAKKKANVSAKFTGPAAYAKTTTPFAAQIPSASGYNKITSPTKLSLGAAQRTSNNFATALAAGDQMELDFSPDDTSSYKLPGKTPAWAKNNSLADPLEDPTAPWNKNNLTPVSETIKQVKKMLETVQTRDDVNFIKKYINHEFDRRGMVNQLATVQRNHLIERVTQIAAGRRRDHARQLAH